MNATSKKKPDGMFATPYGVEVPVYKPDVPDPRDPEVWYFPPESVAATAGIHDPKQRERFIAEVHRTRTIPYERIPEFGGFRPPLTAKLPRPEGSAYNDTPTSGPADIDGASCREIVDRWIDRVSLHNRWWNRSIELLDLCVGQMDGLKTEARGSRERLPDFVVGFPISLMVTGVLENLGEKEIENLEAAAFYALSAHTEWRKAALDWLYPVRGTWWADWVKARQGYRRVAKLMGAVYDDLPPWLYGRSL